MIVDIFGVVASVKLEAIRFVKLEAIHFARARRSRCPPLRSGWQEGDELASCSI